MSWLWTTTWSSRARRSVWSLKRDLSIIFHLLRRNSLKLWKFRRSKAKARKHCNPPIFRTTGRFLEVFNGYQDRHVQMLLLRFHYAVKVRKQRTKICTDVWRYQVKFLKATKNEGSNVYPTTIDGNTIVVSYADSSWAICGRICKPAWELGPFHWCSSDRAGSSWDFGGNLADRRGFVDRRWQRKQIAADASVDRSVYQNYMLSELLQQKPAFQISTENLLRSLHVTDCKSLYDCISAMNPNTSEKRVIIDIRSIQQHVGRQEIHWVPTELMFCDCLTKISKALMQTFQGWLQQPWIQLRSSWFTPKKNSRVWV